MKKVAVRRGEPVVARLTLFRGRWQAQVQVRGQRHYLGLFESAEEASEAVALQLVTVEVCTGIGASWCPVHGDCVCPRDEDGAPLLAYEGSLVRERDTGNVYWDPYARSFVLIYPYCPLHSPDSEHDG